MKQAVTLFSVFLAILATAPKTADGLEHGLYKIRSKWSCPRGRFCNYALNYKRNGYAYILKDTKDTPLWEVEPLCKGNQYYIRSLADCPRGRRCKGSITRRNVRTSASKTFVKVIKRNVPWKITKRQGYYRIQSTWRCSSARRLCNGELSWDTRRPGPIVTIEGRDPCNWEFVLVKRLLDVVCLKQ